MRITEAATRLGTSPRMLRYRDLLGLLPPVREAARERPRAPGPGGTQIRGTRAPQRGSPPAGSRGARLRGAPSHRQFDQDDLDAVAMALDFERRHDVSPAAVAFGMRVLTEPGLRAELAGSASPEISVSKIESALDLFTAGALEDDAAALAVTPLQPPA